MRSFQILIRDSVSVSSVRGRSARIRNSLSLVLLMVLSLVHPFAVRAMASSQALVITHVTVIDVVGGLAKPDLTVVINDDRITAVGKATEVKVPEGAQVVDAAGKYLIPGLWDMHVHLLVPENRDTYLPLLIVNGVTGVRDMGSSGNEDDFFRQFYVLRQWRKEAAAGTLLVPRIFAAGMIVNGIWCLNCILARDEVEGRQVVKILKDSGADFVKVYDMLKSDVYFAIMDEAKQQGLPVAGHVPLNITVAQASDAGQKSVEHLVDILWACSTDEAELRKSFNEIWEKENPKRAFRELWGTQLNTLLSTYSQKKAADLFARFRSNGTWQVPTLITSLQMSSFKEPSVLTDPRLRYFSTRTKERWDRRILLEGGVDTTIAQTIYRKEVEIVGALNRAGVPLLAGTDLNVPYVYPGFSLHDELTQFVKAGLTPTEALRTATINPAKYFNLEKTLGTIEPGKTADLVLLDANPLADINNTRKIAAVVLGGRYLPREKLQTMLADVEALSKKP